MKKKKRAWRSHPRHEITERVVNLEGPVLPVTDITVYSWHRARDGQGKPEQVHVVINSPAMPPQVLRLKSRGACDSLIIALQNHRDDVFPKKGKD